MLVDSRNRILSTGFNGPPHGWPHCRYDEDSRCPGALAKSGTALDQCYALHSEQNALAHCPDKSKIFACYCTASPCATVCVKELLQTSCVRVVFLEEYSQPEARELWTRFPLIVNDKYVGTTIKVPRTWELFQGEHDSATAVPRIPAKF